MELFNNSLRVYHIDGKPLLPGEAMSINKEQAEQFKAHHELEVRKPSKAAEAPDDKQAK